MFGTKSKARKEEEQQNALKAIADSARTQSKTATDTAAKPDPITQRIMDRATALDDWESGKSGPIDIRKMPGGEAKIALYNDAKTAHDSGRLGKGIGSLTGDANPSFAASLDKENELERDLAAKGALESNVNTTLAVKDATLGNLSQLGEQRQMNVANLRQNAYDSEQRNFMQYLLRPKQPSFLKQLILAGVSQTGQYATAAAGA